MKSRKLENVYFFLLITTSRLVNTTCFKNPLKIFHPSWSICRQHLLAELILHQTPSPSLPRQQKACSWTMGSDVAKWSFSNLLKRPLHLHLIQSYNLFHVLARGTCSTQQCTCLKCGVKLHAIWKVCEVSKSQLWGFSTLWKWRRYPCHASSHRQWMWVWLN